MFQFKGTRVPLNSTVLANILISFSVICLLMSCQGLRHVRNSLEDIVVDQSLGRAHIGIEIRSVTTGRYLFTQNAQKHFIPASNMKLYTTAAAILSLTPDFTYETRLMTDGSITNGVLKGNLIIIGAGDPSISGYFNGGNITAVFEDWSKALTRKGVKRIDGNIYIDNSYFTESAYGRGWQLDDLTHCYAAARDALSFNNNCIAITVHAGSEIGSPAIIRIEPDTRYLKLTNRVVSSDPGGHISVVKSGSEDSLALTGHIPLNSRPYVLFEPVRRPALFAASVFSEILNSNGIALDGEIRLREGVITTTGMPALTPIASHRSPPLYEIVKVINTISNNLYAENLLLTIGKETSGHG
ncbi:MAG TPA: D-alanyl-D-alanine carboxypeptidase/D-alanyl-D-alanine-endopeptidase, partial [Syntrophorhabdaceae bacterium]|nr:D-alanyl-D-alanine carboxypeptidase/D-alanyl-D-alanine-endopeptidase [Syntrophorhabdaceae bacterium]